MYILAYHIIIVIKLEQILQLLSWQIYLIIYNYLHSQQLPKVQMEKYTNIAKQIISTNNLDAYNKLVLSVLDPSQLNNVLQQCKYSQQLMFAVSSIVIKKISSNQFIETDYEIATVQNNHIQQKKNSLIQFIKHFWNLATTLQDKLAQHVYRSLLDAVAISMKCLSQFPIGKEQMPLALQEVCPTFIPSPGFCNTSSDSQSIQLIYVPPGIKQLPPYHYSSVYVLTSLIQYKVNVSYSSSYYLYRRHIYQFRTQNLAFILNFAIERVKIAFEMYNRSPNKRALWGILHHLVSLLQKIVMYPYTLKVHESQFEDQVHDNISGLQTEIYFPTYFRGFICDTVLYDLSGYLISLIREAVSQDQVRQQLGLLIRIIGRCVSTTDYIFSGEDERVNFRKVSLQIMNNIMTDQKYFEQYYFMCLSKIIIKILVLYTDKDYGNSKQVFFETLCIFLKRAMISSRTSIQDGQKNQIRLIFDVLIAMLNNNNVNQGFNKKIEAQSQQILHLFFQKLLNNDENDRMIKQFGENNSLEVECFSEIFQKVPEIFQLQLSQNLSYLRELNFSSLNKSSSTFWLHLCALLLPQHDTSQEQTQLILKFFHAAISACSIASLHYITTLISEVLSDVQEGISVTYLWKFMEQGLTMSFQNFLTEIIKYTVNIFSIPNYTLIQNGLQLFKTLFTKLCKIKHKSFSKYFSMVEQISRDIDNTMLVNQQYVKLRIDFFSVISMIWVSENQLSFVYKIVENIRDMLGKNNDILHFMRYLIDITGILDPVESTEVFTVLVQLILNDLDFLLPAYLGNQEKIKIAFEEEQFLRAFMRFVQQLTNDNSYRLSYETHSDLGIRIEETFRPYILQAINFDYPKKTVQIYQQFLKLNPLSQLLPFRKQFKQKNPVIYKSLLRDYFQNIHRFRSIQQFYYMYSLIEDNVQLMLQWWEEIIIRDIRPQINLTAVINAKIWNTSRQKENFGKMIYRIARYDDNYWKVNESFTSQSQYAKWFAENFE